MKYKMLENITLRTPNPQPSINVCTDEVKQNIYIRQLDDVFWTLVENHLIHLLSAKDVIEVHSLISIRLLCVCGQEINVVPDFLVCSSN